MMSLGSASTIAQTPLGNRFRSNLSLHHVHIQAQDRTHQQTPPGRTQIQAIIVQTPHHFNITATPVHSRPPPVINYSVEAECIAAIVELSDDSELEDGSTENLCVPQKQPKSSSQAEDIWAFFNLNDATKERTCTFCG